MILMAKASIQSKVYLAPTPTPMILMAKASLQSKVYLAPHLHPKPPGPLPFYDVSLPASKMYLHGDNSALESSKRPLHLPPRYHHSQNSASI